MTKDSPSVAIVTDSTSDIPPEDADRLNISVVPAILTIGGKSFKDGQEITRQTFYEKMPSLLEPATTAVPSPGEFETVYRSRFEEGASHIVSIHVSSKLSGMFNSASQAAKAYGDRVHVVDSEQVSLGLGFQVMEAAIEALSGADLSPIVKTVRDARKRVRVVAMIDTLEYLKRSGRVSWLRAGLGDLLQIKLLLRVHEGEVEALGKARTRTKALKQLIEYAHDWGKLKRVAILHTAATEEARSIAETFPYSSQIAPLVVDVTTIIGTHVGPNSIGLAALQA